MSSFRNPYGGFSHGPVVNPSTGRMYGSGLAHITAHCLHCKANRRMMNPHQMHTGHHYYLLGKCAVCGNKISHPIPDPHGGQKGSGVVSQALGSIPGIGAIAGPIASLFGLGEDMPLVKGKRRNKKH